jgi:hypothetical protein
VLARLSLLLSIPDHFSDRYEHFFPRALHRVLGTLIVEADPYIFVRGCLIIVFGKDPYDPYTRCDDPYEPPWYDRHDPVA